LLFAVPALRVRGINLAVVTLALAIAADKMIFNDQRITGGDVGRSINAPSLFGLNLAPYDEPRRWALVVIILTIGACAAVGLLRRSRLGMRFLAVRANERGAAASGVSLVGTKLLAFAVSAFLAGCSGALLAYNFGQIGPASFGTVSSVLLVAYVYLGGIGAIAGGVIAGVIAPFGILVTVIGIHNEWINLIAGLGIINMVVNHPSGLAGLPNQIRSHFSGRRHAAGAAGVAAVSEDELSAGSQPVISEVL
jgi:ABC-type branched-subunit amino acid transport system permease subunit